MRIRMIAKAAAALALAAAGAQGAVIDFSDRALWASGASRPAVIDGATLRLSATRRQTAAGKTQARDVRAGADGHGVSGDEISKSRNAYEALFVDFSEDVLIGAIGLSNLYAASGGDARERAAVSFDRGPARIYRAVDRHGEGGEGLRDIAVAPERRARRLVFTVASPMDGDLSEDDMRRGSPGDTLRRIAFERMGAGAPAAIPLPTAFWMLASAVIAVAAFGRMRMGAPARLSRG